MDNAHKRLDGRQEGDGLPPHSPAAEAGVLGCVLLDPQALDECVESFAAGAEVFYVLAHQLIYAAMVAQQEHGAVDLLSVCERLRVRGELEQAGGRAEVSRLADAAISTANLGTYVAIVLDRFRARQMLRVFVARGPELMGATEGTAEILNSVEADVLNVNRAWNVTQTPAIKELVLGAIDDIESHHRRGIGVITGIGTGFSYLDKMTSGLQRGEYIVIAARPSCGKTSLGMNIAERVAADAHIPVGVFSLEMSSRQLAMRLVCARARADFQKIRTGYMDASDFPKITKAAAHLAKAPLFIDASPKLAVETLRARLRRMVHQQGVRLAVVDYLQLLTTLEKIREREERVAHISGELHAAAIELDIPIVVLAQLNREIEKGKHRKPMLSDLRESGAIEQDADTIGMLYAPKPEDEDEETKWKRLAEHPVNLLIAKQRNGPTGDVELLFRKWCMRFEDMHRQDKQEALPETEKGMPDFKDWKGPGETQGTTT